MGAVLRGGLTLRAPKELQLDVVGVAESEHGVRGVEGFLHTGVAYSELVQPGGPGVEVAALGDQELQVIQPRPELGECTRIRPVINQAQLHAAAQLTEVDQCDVAFRLDIAAGFLRAEQVAIPGRTALGVADGADDNLADDLWHRPSVTAGDCASNHLNAKRGVIAKVASCHRCEPRGGCGGGHEVDAVCPGVEGWPEPHRAAAPVVTGVPAALPCSAR